MPFRFSITSLVLLVIGLASTASAGEVAGVSHRARLYDAALHGGTIYVVGYPGLLLRSADGQQFAPVSVPTQEALFSIDFNKAGVGAIVGRGGLVLVTGDAGKTWSKSNALPASAEGETKTHLYAVDVLDSGTIVAVGDFATIVTSSDRGKTWQPRTFDPTDPAAAAAEGERGGFMRLDENENAGFEGEARLASVAFADNNRGFVVGEFGMILASEDGGATWKRQHSPTDVQLYDVQTIDAKRAVIAGSDGTVLETRDAGKGWSAVPTPKRKHLFGVWATGAKTIAVGGDGTIFVRTGNEPFKLVKTPFYTWLSSVLLVDDNRAIAVGGLGHVLSSRDGGQTFARVLGE